MHAQCRVRPSTRICLAAVWILLSALCIFATNPKTKNPNNLLTVVVDGRALSGPNTSARREAGRVLVPAAAIARALHFTLSISGRTVTVERPGAKTLLDAESGRVVENGAVVLSFVGPDVILTSSASELMLPSDLAAALLGVSIRTDDTVVNVSSQRQVSAAQGPSGGRKVRKIADLYRVDFELGSSKYATATSHNAVLTATGRVADGRFLLTTTGTSARGLRIQPRTALFELERPNGQRFSAGDMVAASGTEFLAANIRGVAASVPVGRFIVTAFGGMPNSGESTSGNRQAFSAGYQGKTYGALIESANIGRRTSTISWTAGLISFDTSIRSGRVASGVASYSDRRLQVRADVAVGSFKNVLTGATRSAAFDVTATYQLSDNLAVQGRMTHIGRGYAGLRQASLEASDVKAAGVNWSPKCWISASFNAALTTRPIGTNRRDAFATAAVSLSPTGRLMPRLFVSHTLNNSSAAGSSSFTLLNASKEFRRWRAFLNATSTRTSRIATMNLQLGANVSLSDRMSLEASQSFGSRNSLTGALDLRMSSLASGRLSFTAGAGYGYTPSAGMTPYGRATASLSLPRQSSVQVSYVATGQGPSLLVSVRGTLFKKRQADKLLDSDIGTANSFAGIRGRVYQDVNLNGVFDAGVDKPQADVKVRVDGNRYVVSNAQGEYKLETISPGGHDVSLDLTSVRADLTLLTGGQQNVDLRPATSNAIDFRLVRTGRLHGRVWFDANENGKFDEGEKALADVRVYTTDERDTLTDPDGYYTLGDLAPGEVTVHVDQATLPEKTAAPAKPLIMQVYPGRETADADLLIRRTPAEVKRFGSKPKN